MTIFQKFRKETLLGNWVLFLSVFCLIFLIPLFPLKLHTLLYTLLFSTIFLMAVLAVKKNRTMMLRIALLVVIIVWLSALLKLEYLTGISRFINILFFVYIVVRLILQVAATQRVTVQVILESINGYLLLGIAFSLLVAIIDIVNPDAFNFPAPGSGPVNIGNPLSDYLYFGFVTLATLGYGDIVPTAPLTKSLATLIAVTGQIYVAVIIAMLVGKYAGSKNSGQ